MSETSESVTLVDRVADEIRTDICIRSLKPGDMLGTEAQLAAKLNISRNAVRYAIGRLHGLGLVDSRKSKGVVVAQSDPAETLSLVIPQYVVDHATFSELVELRWSLEIGSVEPVVQHATDADLARLRELGNQLHTAASGDRDVFDELDIEFHKTILSASKNPLLSSMHHVLVAIFWRAHDEYRGWRRMPEPPGEHAAIAAAFASRDADAARTLLKEHLLKYSTLSRCKEKACPEHSRREKWEKVYPPSLGRGK